MPSNFSYNPFVTTNALGSFSVQSDGYVAGVALDDPVARFALSGGPLAASETQPMWGGVPIQELIPTLSQNDSQGSTIARATTEANMAGFSVFNQATAWVNSPQSECPSAGAGMTIPYYRFGCGARIALPMDPDLSDLAGGATNQQVSWDFNNGVLQPYSTSATQAITSITATYNTVVNPTTGDPIGSYTVEVITAAASLVGAVGDFINISGSTGTGNALINGNHVVSFFTDNEHFYFTIFGQASGAIGTQAGTQLLNYGSGALPVKVLKVSIGNSKVVQYDAVNNLVHWKNNGSVAIVLI